MSQTIKNKGNVCFLVYGDVMPLTSIPKVPVMDAAPRKKTMDAATRKKLERVLDLLEKYLTEPDLQEDTGSTWEAIMSNKTRREEKLEKDRQEAQQAYMDRNPHKVREKEKRSEWWDESSVTVPARLMKDSAPRRLTPCEEAEAAYADRNPHKAR